MKKVYNNLLYIAVIGLASLICCNPNRGERTRFYNEKYIGDYTSRIAFPIGGMGTGMFCIEGSGAISNMSLRHRPEVFHEPTMFAALHVKGVENTTKILEGQVPDWKKFGMPLSALGGGGTWGLPRYKENTFSAHFPFAEIELKDDKMLMTQAAWQPPYIYVNAVGGFGVMNADGEWNDSRQSLFAETILQYGKLLNKKEYNERGLSAIRASFSMMYCPENPLAKEQWEKVWPFFNEKDYGFTMENYGHDGRTSKDGMGIGEFTIYDWGNGAAAEAYNRIRDKFGIEIFR